MQDGIRYNPSRASPPGIAYFHRPKRGVAYVARLSGPLACAGLVMLGRL